MRKMLVYCRISGFILATALVICAGSEQSALTGSVPTSVKLYQTLIGQTSSQQKAVLYKAVGQYTMDDVDGLLKLMSNEVQNGAHRTSPSKAATSLNLTQQSLASIWQQAGVIPASTSIEQMATALGRLDQPSQYNAKQLQQAQVTVNAGVVGMLVSLQTQIDALQQHLRSSRLQLTDSTPTGFGLVGAECLNKDTKKSIDEYRTNGPDNTGLFADPQYIRIDLNEDGRFYSASLRPQGKKNVLVKDVKVKVRTFRHFLPDDKEDNSGCASAIAQYYFASQYRQPNMTEDVVRYAQDQLSRPNPWQFSCFGAGCVTQ